MLHFTGTGNPLRIKCDPVTLMSHDQGADKQEQYASFSIKKLWFCVYRGWSHASKTNLKSWSESENLNKMKS